MTEIEKVLEVCWIHTNVAGTSPADIKYVVDCNKEGEEREIMEEACIGRRYAKK